MQQLDLLYDISDGAEAVPVLCDNLEAKKYFIYAASCPETHASDEDAADSQEVCGCSCSNGCSDVDDCACKLLLPGTSVNMRECGSACACSANRRCRNSPVFNGLTCRLVIRSSGAKGLGKRTRIDCFDCDDMHTPPTTATSTATPTSRNHAGVFALENIQCGKFVCEYAGQRIHLEDALGRTTKKHASVNIGFPSDSCVSDSDALQSHHNYILIFKEHFADGRSICTCLDPTHVGNVGRFINHSCVPNLDAHAVRVGGQPQPRVALFAARDILVGEELTFSYHESSVLRDNKSDRKPCFCGHAGCNQW